MGRRLSVVPPKLQKKSATSQPIRGQALDSRRMLKKRKGKRHRSLAPNAISLKDRRFAFSFLTARIYYIRKKEKKQVFFDIILIF